VLMAEVERGRNPNMKEFLESQGRPTFQDLMMWVQSTGCAQDIHLYDDIDLGLSNDLEIPTINVELKDVIDLTWAFNITKLEVSTNSSNSYFSLIAHFTIQLQERIEKSWRIMRGLLTGKATISHPTLRPGDFALGIVLKIRILERIKLEAEKGNTAGVGCMRYFLGTKGWVSFESFKDWILSTGCVKEIQIYDDVECLNAGHM
jgi:hypothetical protein